MTTTIPPSTTVGDRAAGGGPDLADRLRRLARGRESDPPWVRPSLLALLAATALLYLWGLDASGYANTFYSAAVQAATKSWKAMFFGSSDASNFITVDKPPASLWPSDLAARIFGLSPWTVLAPQALAGVASVAVLYGTVRRWFSAGAALLAGAILALTPVATLTEHGAAGIAALDSDRPRTGQQRDKRVDHQGRADGRVRGRRPHAGVGAGRRRADLPRTEPGAVGRADPAPANR